MRKINCIICDHCRKVCADPLIVQGKKRELHFCDEKCKAKHMNNVNSVTRKP